MSKEAEQHAVRCDDRWVSQFKFNEQIAARVRHLELRFATAAGLGALLGSIVAKLLLP